MDRYSYSIYRLIVCRMNRNSIKISKFLSFVLRHKPEAIGLSLDAEGWADVDELIHKADVPISHALLYKVVSENDKKRFVLSGDKKLIRANQGHSIEVDLGLKPAEPPKILYHGTATRFLDSIYLSGLLPQNRQYVHLSPDFETATKVGERHGKSVVLIISALAMHQEDHQFFQAHNGVWLIKAVPENFISPRVS